MKENLNKKEKSDQLYTLKAILIQGLVTEKFYDESPVVSRTIEIKGSQTLMKLHYAIFDSVEFDDEHMYAFEIGGRKPYSKTATRYAIQPPGGRMMGWGGGRLGDSPKEKGVTQTKISSLGLKSKQKFFYEFDFGDEWWWEIQVISISDEVPKGKFPRVTERIGENPPQYLSEDEWEDEE